MPGFKPLRNIPKKQIGTLQTSLNYRQSLGGISMAVVYISMVITCVFTPFIVDKLSAKWTIVLGLFFNLAWIAANFVPTFATLMPTSIAVGFGQSLAWGAQVTYMQKLSTDYSQTNGEFSHYKMYKFNGAFLACFQTSHIWGNLASSLLLNNDKKTNDFNYCGVYDRCRYQSLEESPGATLGSDGLRLMTFYSCFAVAGFVIILFFLEDIRSPAERPSFKSLLKNYNLLRKHRKFAMLVPLLVFNGFEQAFVYADYNKSFIACTNGINSIGYNMICLGVTSAVFSILIGLTSNHVPREAVIGCGAIVHLGAVVFLLVWIPDRRLPNVLYIVSAVWGVCDAIWQTQCNYLVNLSCPEMHDIAFQNFRLLQGLGAASVFVLGTFCCVTVKLYVLISLLVLSVLGYAAVEYDLRRTPLQPMNALPDAGEEEQDLQV